MSSISYSENVAWYMIEVFTYIQVYDIFVIVIIIIHILLALHLGLMWYINAVEKQWGKSFPCDYKQFLLF